MKLHTVHARKHHGGYLKLIKALYVVGFSTLFYVGLWGANNDLFSSHRQPVQKTQIVALETRNNRRAPDDKDKVKGLVEPRTDLRDIKLRASGDTDKKKAAMVELRKDGQRSGEKSVPGTKAGDKSEAKGVNSDVAQRTVLMVVAHADDDVLWGGEYLLKEGHKAHVVVTSTRNRRREERFEEFMAVQQRLGSHGEFLNGKDSPDTMELESDIKKRIRDLVCSKEWERIITHGPEGEYGHPQHQLVHDAVLEACCACSTTDQLYVFQPRPVNKYIFPEAKSAVAKIYKSQANVIFKMFGRWKEQIVPMKDYDYKGASEICRELPPGKYRKCRLHKMLDFSDPNYRESMSVSDQGVGCTKQQVTQDHANTKKRLETPCGEDEARLFVTFAVLREPGRWHVDDGARAIRILYSSLVRSHGCAVQLHVHTNLPLKDAEKSYGSNRYTTMGTKMNGLVFHELNESYLDNPYKDKTLVPHATFWFSLSRAKLDTYEEYLIKGIPQQPVWVDLDTVVFDKAAVNAPVPWVYGYHFGKKKRNTCFGDLFSLDKETVQDIRRLEKELVEGTRGGNGTSLLPKYDLQGYFGMLLDRQEHSSLSSNNTNDNTSTSSHLHVVQEELPDFSFGFDCSRGMHPSPEHLKEGVKVWKEERGQEGKPLVCKNFRGKYAKVASISFTASTYQLFFLNSTTDATFDTFTDEVARQVLNNFFYNLSASYP